MINYINKFKIVIVALFLTTVSCNDYLDETPDNRTQLDSKEKIQKLLNSAYLSNSSYAFVTELSSDNIADYGENNPNSNRFLEQVAYWEDITETDNDDLKFLWEECYLAIANANQALSAIEEYEDTLDLSAEKGEALITRAYLHFILVNVFGKHYNQQTSDSDLGVVYMQEPETVLKPTYKRESVKSNYEKIEKDIIEGLPLINDEIYDVSKFHFTKVASYAFAARFFLYYEKWDQAEKYANLALEGNGQLRKWDEMGALPRSASVLSRAYFEDDSNYLLQTSLSKSGLVFGPYYFGSRFNHTHFINENQTMYAPTPWSEGGSVDGSNFYLAPSILGATNLEKSLHLKIPYLFEYTDPVAGIGFNRSVLVPFHAEETLLMRAEAKILQGNLEGGLADINTWSANFYKVDTKVTIEKVNEFYNNLPYSEANNINQKNKLNPKFNINGGDQENLLHYLLQCRRILTIHEGLRWFDIKRYGIEVFRILYSPSGIPSVSETLTMDDPRRALQLPQDVISAGLAPNPR